MLLSKADINLINRAILHIRSISNVDFQTYGSDWGATRESKSAKRHYDRLKRDERDLIALRRRLEATCSSESGS